MYDYQAFTFQKVGGVSRYFCEIIRNLPDEFEYEVSGIVSNNLYLNEMLKKKSFNFFPNNTIKGKDRIIEIPNKIDSIYKCCKVQYDIFHPTYYDPYFLKYNKKPFILTIHDMIHEKFAEYIPKEKSITGFKKELAYKANHIIAVSNNTKNDILHYYEKINPDKVSVIYHGNSLFKVGKSEISFQYNYILYTGERTRYKNFKLLINAISDLLIKYDLHLVCTGSKFTADEYEIFMNEKISSRVHNVYVKDSEMFSLYNQAVAFVFPSLYEGFGIPILEAFASGCPAIISNSSSLPEIAGNAAMYFNPIEIDDIRNSIENVITNSNLRKILIEKGYERVKDFNWSKASLETSKIYKSI